MAEIYINPASDVNWATDSEPDVAPQVDAGATEAVQAAATLLKQLRPSDMQSSKYKVRVMHALSAKWCCHLSRHAWRA